jgi:putative two-component system response regulator
MIELIQWHEEFSVGSEIIDRQHKQLFTLINKLISAVNNEQNVDTLGEILGAVVDYTHFHFQTEEEIIKSHPSYENHSRIHRDFTSDMRRLAAAESENSFKEANVLLESLTNWLKDHILKTDIEYFSDLGYRPAESGEEVKNRLSLLAKVEKVLVVDDNPVIRRLLEKHLQMEGYEVLQAADGREALQAIDDNFDLNIIITDIQMPVMDGFKLIKAIRESHLTAAYIFVITNVDDRDSMIKALKLGANDYLLKPIHHQELSFRLKNCRQLLGLEGQDELIFSMAKLADCRSPETGMHLERVRKFTYLLAHHLIDNCPELGMTESMAMEISTGSPLHDIGKVGIADGILNKPDRLTPDEFTIMKTHASIGGNLIGEILRKKPSRKLRFSYEMTFYHHEKWDGSGYPLGLRGQDIPLAARIMALADVYDALTTERVYKKALSRQKARSIIMESSGSHFDPVLVEAFQQLEKQFHQFRVEMADISAGADTLSAGM